MMMLFPFIAVSGRVTCVVLSMPDPGLRCEYYIIV